MPQRYSSGLNDIEAEQLTPANVDELAAWCGGRRVEEIDAIDDSKKYVALNVPTLDGPKRAHENDYIVKSPSGNFRVTPRNKFEAVYFEL